MGYTQNCEIWHGVSLGTMIKIQEEPIGRTMWGPCFGHKGPYFGHFYGKGTMWYTQNCEIWHGVSLGKLIMIEEETIWRTMWGPCFSHKRPIFWPFLGKLKISVNIDARNLKFGMEHPWANWLGFMKNQFEGPCEDHYVAIKGPYFGHF